MTSGPRVDVVVPNFNGEKLLPECIAALDQQLFPSFRVTVVDNGSTDGSRDVVRHRSKVRWIQIHSNSGFGAAVNRGIVSSDAEYIALLNNDARPEPGWLAALVAALDAFPKASSATSKILSLRLPGHLDNVGDALGRRGIAYPTGHMEPDVGQYAAPRWVFGACGGAALYRRNLFYTVGLFDTSLFAYHEDVDISFRAQLAGLGCIYVPTAVVHHIGGATSGSKINSFNVYHSTRNALVVLVKNLPLSLGIRYFPHLVAGQVLWFAKMAVRERQFLAWLRGVLAGLGALPLAVMKRGNSERRISTNELRSLIQQSETEIRESIRRKRAHAAIARKVGESLRSPGFSSEAPREIPTRMTDRVRGSRQATPSRETVA